MFGTLHWNLRGKEGEFIERPYGSLNLERNLACDRCRARKVKCKDLDNGGCSRCIRLGKTCTLSTVKPQGDHRIQETSINKQIAHQHSLLSLPHPLASSRCQDTEHEKEPEDKGREKQARASSLPDSGDGNGNGNGNDDGDENVNDILPTVDLSSFANLSSFTNFDQELSDQGGEDSSSFAFFPAILDSTQPEPEPSSITGMSGPSGQPCGCFAAVILAVEQLEASCHPGHRAELDSVITYQKEAIKRCRTQLKCSSCIPRRETIVLLNFMLEKIVAACGRIVGLYSVKEVQVHLPSSLPVNNCGWSLDPDLVPFKADCPVAREWRELLLGDYDISSPLEWEHLVRVLILLQLRAAMGLVADLKSTASERLGEIAMASLARAEIRLGELEKRMLISYN